MTLTKNITQLALVLGLTLGFSSVQATLIFDVASSSNMSGNSTISVNTDTNRFEIDKEIGEGDSSASFFLDFDISGVGATEVWTFEESILNNDVQTFAGAPFNGMPWDGYKTSVEIFDLQGMSVTGFTVIGDSVSGTTASGNMVSLLSTVAYDPNTPTPLLFNFSVDGRGISVDANGRPNFDGGTLRLTETAWLTTVVPVPEPTSLALIGIALGGLGWSNRKKR